MAQLIQMRQRIQSVETIKKITQAMRLVSMSAHAQLTRQQRTFQHYYTHMTGLFAKLQAAHPMWINRILTPQSSLYDHPLLIIIGSQKGLCGSFNSNLFQAFGDHMAHTHYRDPRIIAVGKKAADFIGQSYHKHLITEFIQLTPQTVGAIAQAIINRIFEHKPSFSRVVVISNSIKSFFMQNPQATQIIPFSKETYTTLAKTDEYSWDQDPHALLDMVGRYALTSQVHHLLLQSLLAEHAARFVSMDSSTRNAEKILEATRLRYNKLRQAKITKEIMELADIF
jgi:F-type H+-transporting ATPase subunit gamma